MKIHINVIQFILIVLYILIVLIGGMSQDIFGVNTVPDG